MNTLYFDNVSNSYLKNIVYAYGVLYQTTPKVYITKGKFQISTKYSSLVRREIEITEDTLVSCIKTKYLIIFIRNKEYRITPSADSDFQYKVTGE